MAKGRVLLIAAVLACWLTVAAPAMTSMPWLYQRCSHLNMKYPHGVGKAGARDITKGASEPVTNFKRSTRIYRLAMSYNKRLDADKDGVACEKH